MANILIRGGTVLDGTGAKGIQADVRIEGSKITEIGADLRSHGEREIDARGAYVAPGFIDCHTHFDGPMWWAPHLQPLPGYGTTTAVVGNCGLSVAPMSKKLEDRKDMIGIFSFLEDIPQRAFEKEVPWSWESWPEYASAMGSRPAAANISALLGHLNLRIYVMGAAAWERTATPEECTRMAALLDEGMRAGALGLSTNFFDVDMEGRKVPSRLADDAEFEALLDVLAHYPGSLLQFALDVFIYKETAIPCIERMARLCQPRGIRLQPLLVPMENEFAAYRQELIDCHHRLRAAGVDIWMTYLTRPFAYSLSFERTLVFRLQDAHAWADLVDAPAEDKIAMLEDPEWRARARHEFDHGLTPGSNLSRAECFYLNQSENEAGPINITLKQYADELGLHHSDAMAEWLLRNGLGSTIAMETLTIDEDAVVAMLRDPYSVTGANDAGAHGQLICGAGESTYLLTHYVRTGKLNIEETVQALTGKLAQHFNLKDRGFLTPGMAADVCVFALDEIEYRPIYKIRDVPDGRGGVSWRYTRDAAPFRATIVNGELTFEAGRGYTNALPGRLVSRGFGGSASRAAD